jgi:hypothetical protein
VRQSQINLYDKGILHKLYELLHLTLFTPILILVDHTFLYLSDRLRTVSFKKYILHVLTQLGIVPEEAADEVVSEKLVKVNHLNQVDVQVQGCRGGGGT